MAPSLWLLVLLALGVAAVLAVVRQHDAVPPAAVSLAAPQEARPADPETLRAKAETQLAGDLGRRAPIRLVLRDGRSQDADLLEETAAEVTVSIGGVRRVFRQSQIERLVRLPDLATRYRQWRAQIDDDDVVQLEQLVDWLVGKELYHVAHFEISRLVERRPRDTRLRAMLKTIRGQTRLFERRGMGVKPERAEGPEPLPLLTPEQINLIRVFELDLLDPPRLRIPRDVVQRFLVAYRDDPRLPQTPEGRVALAAAEPERILRLMFELQAREFYGQVVVQQDPKSMRLFRQDVRRWLVPGCATSRCHGGAEAGQLRLERRRASSEPGAYTNFLILQRFRLADGTPLIDFEQPERSPLLHLGLARDRSRYPHPEIPRDEGPGDAWKPVFRTVDDPDWRNTTAWIRSLYQPRPEYPIEYPPAGSDAGATEGPADPAGRGGG